MLTTDTAALASRDYDRDRDYDRKPSPVPAPTTAFGEYGTVQADSNWQTLTLQGTYTNPVAIFSDPTFNGGQPVAVRLRNIGSQSLEFSLQEPAYLDGIHKFEQLSYMVVEAGTWNVNGMTFTAGTINSNQLTEVGFSTVALPNMGADTSVLTQVQTFNNPGAWLTTRTDAITGSGFRVTMQQEEAVPITGRASMETVGYLAFSGSATTMGDVLIQGGLTGTGFSDAGATAGFAKNFAAPPTLFAKIGTFNGGDPVVSRITGVTASGFSAFVQEDQSFDAEVFHKPEAMSYLAFGGSSGLLVGTQVLAADPLA